MAHRRPIASHPAFPALLAAWFAALLGLAVAVLPEALVAPAAEAVGLGDYPWALRIVAAIVAALIGGGIGRALGRAAATRARGGPAPVYDDERDFDDHLPSPATPPRPLRIHEDLLREAEAEDAEERAAAFPADAPPMAEWHDDRPSAEAGPAHTAAWDAPEAAELPAGPDTPPASPEPALEPAPAPSPAQAFDTGFLILDGRSRSAAVPAADLESLIARFDRAIAAAEPQGARGDGPSVPDAEVGAGRDPDDRSDPHADMVQAFVARQTAARASGVLTAPFVDHQAQLRSALDRLTELDRGR